MKIPITSEAAGLPAVQETIGFQAGLIPSVQPPDEVSAFYLSVSVLMFQLCEFCMHIKYCWIENPFFVFLFVLIWFFGFFGSGFSVDPLRLVTI